MAGSMQSALPTTLSTRGPGNRISARAATQDAQAWVAGSTGTPIGGRVLFECSALCGRI